MNCRAARKRLVAYQDHELSPGDHSQVAEHLDACVRCRELDTRLEAVTPRPFLDVDAEPPWDRLDAALDRAWNLPPPRRRSLPVRVAALLAAETSVPTPALLAYAALLVGVLGWGVHSWTTAQRLQLALDQHAGPADSLPTATTEIPAVDYRPAAYIPADAEEP